LTCIPLVGQAGGAVGGGVRVIDGAAAGVLTLIEGVGVALDAAAFGVDVAADVELDDAQPAAAATQISAAAVADSRPAPDLLAPGFTAVASMSGGVPYAVQSH
jgi:hypothetical protein